MNTTTETAAAAEFAPTLVSEAWVKEMGYEWRELRVLRFFDDKEDHPWFYRKHEVLGTIRTICDGPSPINPKEVLACARQECGPDCCVMW